MVSNESLRIKVPAVLDALAAVLFQYPEVLEAYFQELPGNDSEAVLGLLLDDTSSENRFAIAAEIGLVAERYYDFAGAIETYDDLHEDCSRSWELFSALSPFYVREEQSF